MFRFEDLPSASKRETYATLALQLRSLLDGERDPIAGTANAASLIFHALPDLNWAGFYFMKGGELMVGPFQGRPACVRIALGRGVCGTAAATRRTVVVEDVETFPGHIACDAASRSEIVVPLLMEETLVGVLDLDSPLPARFDTEDRDGIEALTAVLVEMLDLGEIYATGAAGVPL